MSWRDLNDSLPSREECAWALAAHLGSAAAIVLIPLIGNIGVALGLYLWKRQESEYVAFNALEALYFQAAVSIALLLLLPFDMDFVGVPISLGVLILSWVLATNGAIRSNAGDMFDYPVAGRLARRALQQL